MSDEEKRHLLKHKLRELEADEIGNYAADVFLTVGSLDDFKYFLPRILELSVNERFSWPDPEVVFGKLKLADWENWPEDERTAILELINKKFSGLLEDSESDGSDVDKWVCALGRCVSDITSYLNQLLGEASKDRLLSFVEWNISALTENKLDNAFWEDAPVNAQRLLEWLNQDRIKALLAEQYGMRF